MTDPAFVASLLAGLLAIGGLLTAPFERWVYGSELSTLPKLVAYATYAVLAWALTAVAAWIYPWPSLIVSLGPIAAWLPAPAIAGPVLGAVLGAYLMLALLPLAQSLRGLRRRKAYAAAIRRGFSRIQGFLPNNTAECAGFSLISLTAGICEEVLYRGFLIRFLHEGAPGLPLAGALAASSLAFGLGHAYQGFKGILTTGIGGCAFGVLFLLSGSLIPGIVLHALVDLQVAYILRPVPEDAGATLEAA
jgi:uncharacterized protein